MGRWNAVGDLNQGNLSGGVWVERRVVENLQRIADGKLHCELFHGDVRVRMDATKSIGGSTTEQGSAICVAAAVVAPVEWTNDLLGLT